MCPEGSGLASLPLGPRPRERGQCRPGGRLPCAGTGLRTPTPGRPLVPREATPTGHGLRPARGPQCAALRPAGPFRRSQAWLIEHRAGRLGARPTAPAHVVFPASGRILDVGGGAGGEPGVIAEGDPHGPRALRSRGLGAAPRASPARASAMASLLAKDAYLQSLARKICSGPSPEPHKRKSGKAQPARDREGGLR